MIIKLYMELHKCSQELDMDCSFWRDDSNILSFLNNISVLFNLMFKYVEFFLTKLINYILDKINTSDF